MDIGDREQAKLCLSRINYYRLSAYWYPFRATESVVDPRSGETKTVVVDQFKPNAKFTHALDLYVFDKRLRLIALDALERIEIALRADLSILLGQRDPLAHRHHQHLHGHFSRKRRHPQAETKHEKWLRILDEKASRSREDFAVHFKTKYAGAHMPIWVASELWDFGALSNLFGGLLAADKNAIAANYGIADGAIFETWLRTLNDVRNICAHHSRFWNKPFVNHPAWPAVGSVPELDHIASNRRAQTRSYSALLIIRFLLRSINPNSAWCSRLLGHLRDFPHNDYVTLGNAGFPDGWQNESIWK